MYGSDSFFTLSLSGQIGLGLLSLVLTVGMLLACWYLARSRHIAWRFAIAMILFLLFEWVSPQIYYTYYRVIIPGLPFQVVIGPWPDGITSLNLLSFSGPRTLSAHGRGALGWLLILVAIASGLRRSGPYGSER